MRDSLKGAVRPDGPLVVLVAIALVVRLGAVAIDGPAYVPLNDAGDYDRHARSIASGDGYPDAIPVVAPGGGPSAFRPPGYPFLLGGEYALAGESPQAGRYLNAVLGAIAVLLIYLIARAVWWRRVALVAAALAAVYPPLAFLSLELYAEPLFIDLMLAAVLAAIAYRRDPRLRWVLLAGALTGLAALTRTNALLLLPIIAWALWLPPRRGMEAAAAPLAAVLAAAAIISPWTFRNWLEFDSFVPIATSTGFGLAGVYTPEARTDEPRALWRAPIATKTHRDLYAIPQLREVEIDRELRHRAREFAVDHPGYVAEVVLWSTLRTLNLAESGVATPGGGVYQTRGFGVEITPAEPIAFFLILPLVAAGVIALIRRPARLRGPVWIWLVPLAMVAPALLFLGLPRYRASAEPFLLMLAAIGAVAIWDRLARREAKS